MASRFSVRGYTKLQRLYTTSSFNLSNCDSAYLACDWAYSLVNLSCFRDTFADISGSVILSDINRKGNKIAISG
ncbi:hypothetical protein [Nostoc punctiforme]|jgi:hypothetical protein|uniref:hypothetical protein n=1 Tax=Nostoc punctiforme TaxID=272131 RepID=UPI001427D2D7|nr:hypothetical protein [Nostoc punctiforme]